MEEDLRDDQALVHHRVRGARPNPHKDTRRPATEGDMKFSDTSRVNERASMTTPMTQTKANLSSAKRTMHMVIGE
jgi:hypothetical protein